MNVKVEADVVTVSFADILRQMSRGRSEHDLSRGIQELVKKVRETGKAGTLAYRVKVEPCDRNADQVTVTDEVTVKLPQPGRGVTLFFSTDDGRLLRNDPRQAQLPLAVEEGGAR